MTTGKTIAFTRWTFVGKVMSLLFNMLFRLVLVFLPRSKCLLISWLHLPSVVILEPPKIKSATVSTVSPSICHEVMGPALLTIPLTKSAYFSWLLHLLWHKMMFFLIFSWLTFLYSHLIQMSPSQSWLTTLKHTVSLSPEHLSTSEVIFFNVYCLCPHPMLSSWK